MLRPPSSLRPHTLGGRFRLLSAPLPRRETEVPTPTCPTSAMGSPVGGSDKPAVDEEADSCQHQEQENANDHPANHCHVARSFRGCEEGQLVTREPPHSPPGPHHPGYLWAPRHMLGAFTCDGSRGLFAPVSQAVNKRPSLRNTVGNSQACRTLSVVQDLNRVCLRGAHGPPSLNTALRPSPPALGSAPSPGLG